MALVASMCSLKSSLSYLLKVLVCSCAALSSSLIKKLCCASSWFHYWFGFCIRLPFDGIRSIDCILPGFVFDVWLKLPCSPFVFFIELTTPVLFNGGTAPCIGWLPTYVFIISYVEIISGCICCAYWRTELPVLAKMARFCLFKVSMFAWILLSCANFILLRYLWFDCTWFVAFKFMLGWLLRPRLLCSVSLTFRFELSKGYISTFVEKSKSFTFFYSFKLMVLAILDMFIRICYYFKFVVALWIPVDLLMITWEELAAAFLTLSLICT